MMSLGYTLTDLAKVELPLENAADWVGSQGGFNREIAGIVREEKCNVSIEQLSNGLPGVFEAFLNDVSMLRFKDRPDYKRSARAFQQERNRIMRRNICRKERRLEWPERKGPERKVRRLHYIFSQIFCFFF